MEEHNTTNEKETKHKQYECPCCKIMLGLHNKARHERTKRHKDNLITVKEETQTEEPRRQKQRQKQQVKQRQEQRQKQNQMLMKTVRFISDYNI